MSDSHLFAVPADDLQSVYNPTSHTKMGMLRGNRKHFWNEMREYQQGSQDGRAMRDILVSVIMFTESRKEGKVCMTLLHAPYDRAPILASQMMKFSLSVPPGSL